jgi:capsular exopolysaccharide synthesis family protein
VLDVRAQLNEVNKAVGAEVNRIVDNLKNAYEIAQQREQSIEASLQHLTEQRGNSPAVIKLRELQRVDDADRKIYENFLSLFGEIQQRATLNEADARIINPATLPGAPSYPRRVRIYLIVAGISVVIGFALAFIVEHLDVGSKTSAQVEQALNLPVLGMIPAISKLNLRKYIGRIANRSRVASNQIARLNEVIRSLRMSMMLADADRAPKLILVTSSIPDEGKSTIATLLAASSAEAKQRTLLVDCDIRRKTISTSFGLGNRPGLVEILSGRAECADATFTHEETGISVISAGSGSANSADLLNSQSMRQLLAGLRERYDYIVLDAAPLLPVIDAAILAQSADRILVAVEWRRTPRMSVIEAIKILPAEARRSIGIVITKVDYARLQSYGYGLGHGYNYGHYYRELDRYYRKS